MSEYKTFVRIDSQLEKSRGSLIHAQCMLRSCAMRMCVYARKVKRRNAIMKRKKERKGICSQERKSLFFEYRALR